MSALDGGRRQQAARLLHRTGLLGAWGAVRRQFSAGLTILAYHRIVDIEDEAAFPWDIELVSASVAAFTRQMRFMRDHYHPVTFATVLDHLAHGTPLPKGACIVTFDDGFADNYHQAFPVLKSLGMPATIFLSTGYLDRHEVFWYERLAHAVLATAKAHVAAAGLPSIALGAGVADRRAAIATLLRHLKRIPDASRRLAVDELVEQLHPGPLASGGPSAPLTWDQVREMSAGDIEFGSHTVDHPVLSMLAPEPLRFELRESKARIEAMTGKRCDVIAYPVGGRDAFNAHVQQEVRDAGYRLGVSYMTGIESPSRWDPYAIRRLRIERYVDDVRFRALLAAPALFG